MWCEIRKSGLGIIWIRIRISIDTDCYRETTLSVACFSAWRLRMKKKYLTLKRLTLGSIRKVIPPSWCKCREWRGGGGMGLMEPLSRVFDMWQYFKTIWPSVESLCSSRQDEVYFMGGGAAGGL